MGFLRRSKMPPALAQALRPDETVLVNARLVGGGFLAATRFGLWHVAEDGEPTRWPWPLVSKARWQPPTLSLTVAEVVGILGPAEIILDGRPRDYQLDGVSKLTDVVHQRVRSGIVSSVHHQTAAGGLWLVMRRVPGQDGVSAQVRPDPGTQLTAVEDQVAELVHQALAEFALR